jgi:hypothetical protein
VLRFSCLFAFFATALLRSATAQATNTPIEIPVVCQRLISPRDMEEIRTILLSRSDIRKPFFGITCGGGCAIARTGPKRTGAICNFVTLCHRRGKWSIVKIEEAPIVIITQRPPERPNQTMKLTATTVRP